MIRAGTASHAAAALCCLLLAGCTTRLASAPVSALAGMAPLLSVERFLQAANARDLEAMTGLFGTHEGPIQGEWRELELRMATIAEVLRHEDYAIEGERREPGRRYPTTSVMVTLTKGGPSDSGGSLPRGAHRERGLVGQAGGPRARHAGVVLRSTSSIRTPPAVRGWRKEARCPRAPGRGVRSIGWKPCAVRRSSSRSSPSVR